MNELDIEFNLNLHLATATDVFTNKINEHSLWAISNYRFQIKIMLVGTYEFR